ncbi:MAG: YebC/PmpR family DNA-binding transcriptional regulator, partial [Pseudomonadota bacterium]
FGFDQVGAIEYAAEIGDEEAVLEGAIEAGAEDVASSEDGHDIYTAASDLSDVAAALEKSFGEPRAAKLIWRPQNTVPVEGDQARVMLKLLDALDDNDDVQNVYANFDISDADMESLAD